jgi:aspartate/methionine/tyrosine aminotransferase
MRHAYRQRRDAALAILNDADVPATIPRGAFYLLVDISRVTPDTYAFARRLLHEQRVGVAPGETFGPAGRGLVRVSLAAELAIVAEGIRRLAGVVRGAT